MTTETQTTVQTTETVEAVALTAADRRAAAKAAVLAEQGETEVKGTNTVGSGAWNKYLTDIGSDQAVHDRVLNERGDYISGAIDAHAVMAAGFLTANTDAADVTTKVLMGNQSNFVEVSSFRSRELPGGPGNPRKEVIGHTSAAVMTKPIHPSKSPEIHNSLGEATTAIADALAEFLNK